MSNPLRIRKEISDKNLHLLEDRLTNSFFEIRESEVYYYYLITAQLKRDFHNKFIVSLENFIQYTQSPNSLKKLEIIINIQNNLKLSDYQIDLIN